MITYVFLLSEAIANVPTYLLSSSAFLSIKLADFYCTWSKSHRLVDISCSHPFYKVSFSAKILDWCRYLFIKLELYCESIPHWHLYITQMETKWTKWYAMTSHVIAYRSTEFYTVCTHLILIAFLIILIAYLRKYAAYLGCWVCNVLVSYKTNWDRNQLQAWLDSDLIVE